MAKGAKTEVTWTDYYYWSGDSSRVMETRQPNMPFVRRKSPATCMSTYTHRVKIYLSGARCPLKWRNCIGLDWIGLQCMLCHHTAHEILWISNGNHVIDRRKLDNYHTVSLVLAALKRRNSERLTTNRKSTASRWCKNRIDKQKNKHIIFVCA